MRYLLHLAEHDILCLQHHPLIFRDLVIFVVQLQHKLLDIHAILDYIEVLYPRFHPLPSKPIHANATWMGCFMKITQVCEELYLTGVPVWLYHHEQFIPLTMNIIHPVRLTYPDNIIKAMYSENGVARPFRSIHRGPGSLLCHYNTQCNYIGTFDEAPEPIAGPSTANTSSTQQSSHGSKQSAKKTVENCKGKGLCRSI